MLVHAPAKLNLGLYLGRPRADGLHELCSLFEPLALADLLRIEEAEREGRIKPGDTLIEPTSGNTFVFPGS